MKRSIYFFGGRTQAEITIENGHRETWTIDREVWFDRDIDGRWLVYAERRGHSPLFDGDDETGSIIVKDPHVTAFIDMLSELIAEPAQFHNEPTFDYSLPEGTV